MQPQPSKAAINNGRGNEGEGYGRKEGSTTDTADILIVPIYTGNLYKAVSRLGECCRQVEVEEASNSGNKIHQTREWPHSRVLYQTSVQVQDAKQEMVGN